MPVSRQRLWLGYLLCFCFMMQAAAAPLAASKETRYLQAGTSLTLPAPSDQTAFLIVQNNGIDSFAEALTANGDVLAKAESWRGREGRYVLMLSGETGETAIQVVIRNSGQHIPDGEITFHWLTTKQTTSGFDALRYTAQGFSHHAHGEREAAAQSYRLALDSLSGTAYQDWMADVHYEMGYLALRDGALNEAQESYARALAAYQNMTHRPGMASAHVALGIVARRLGQPDVALEHYHQALSLRQQADDVFYTAQVMHNLGLVEWSSDNLDRAADWFDQAIGLFADAENTNAAQVLAREPAQLSRLADVKEVLRTASNLALVKVSQGQVVEAENLWRSALRWSQTIDQPSRSAIIQTNYGKMLAEQGRLQEALDNLNAAADYFTATDNGPWLAETLMGTGIVYASVGEDEQALAIYQQALELGGEGQQLRASLLSLMAKADHRLGRLNTALEHFEAAQASFLSAEQPSQAAVVKSEQAMVLHAQGQTALALKAQQQAIATLEELGVLREAARAQSRLGQLLLAEGRIAEAEKALNAALEGHRGVSDELFELDTLTALSRAQTGVAALETAKASTDLAGNIRARTGTSELQMSLLASRRHAFERHINLLVDAGDVEQAWWLSENIRARSLLDLVGDASDQDVTALLADGTLPSLRADQAMISYFLGESRSHLWVMNQDVLTHYLLPPADEINAQAAALAVSLRDHRQSPSKIDWLTDQLRDQVLTQALSAIAGKDLIVMADGGLQTIPFNLLTSDNLGGQTPITYTPSARLFALLGEQPTGRGQGLAVLADPLDGADASDVFADPITQFTHLVAQRSADQAGVNLAALPGAQLEARAIADLTQATLLTGQAVNHDWIAKGGLNAFGIIHFATHGVVDADVPALSGLVLAHENNTPRYLRSHEIAQLDLQADLVVLSACETGIGRSIAGEGLMSLSRPFFVAGARQVIASLWKVNDRATAALMERFYFHLLEEQHAPAKALQAAQSWMQSQPEWNHPNFWAGFILQGSSS